MSRLNEYLQSFHDKDLQRQKSADTNSTSIFTFSQVAPKLPLQPKKTKNKKKPYQPYRHSTSSDYANMDNPYTMHVPTTTNTHDPEHGPQHDDILPPTICAPPNFSNAIQTSNHPPNNNSNERALTANLLADEEVYVVKQKRGYLALLFSFAQTAILIIMMIQCGVAPLNINPMIGPYPDALDYWGAKNAIKILQDGENYRLVSPIFLHAGLIHLLGNVSVQMDVGAFFEREWGSVIWCIVYIGSAIGSSILSVCYMPNSIGVGSSGAVCGLFGAKLSEVFCRACESRRTQQGRIGHEVRMEQLNHVLCSVVIVGLFSFIPFVDWAAHLGGFVTGITIGMIFFSCMIKSWLFMVVWCAVGIMSSIVVFMWGYQYMVTQVEAAEELQDVCGYYQQFFDDYDCNCQLNGGGGGGSGDGGNSKD